jgi:hypothetical protein
MFSTSPLNALALGDFASLMDGLLSDDRVQGQVPCPCGQVNGVIAVRTGCVVVMWTDAADKHLNDIDALDVVSYRSVAHAMQAMDELRAEIEQINGMVQLINAVNGDSQTTVTFSDIIA